MLIGRSSALPPGLAAAVESQQRQNERAVSAASQMQNHLDSVMDLPWIRSWNARPRPTQYTRDTAPLWLFWPDDLEPQNWISNDSLPAHELDWQQPAPTDAGHLADLLVIAPAAPPAAGYGKCAA